jgi:hypothetical protein
MLSLISKRIPCSVCGVETLRHQGWYLIADDRWRDRLRIFSWSAALASQPRFQGACSRAHLKMLIACWLDQASMRLATDTDGASALAALGPEEISNMEKNAHLVGELSVFRDTFSRGWTGSGETFDAIVDALIPVDNQGPTKAKPFQRIPNLSDAFPYGASLQ